MSNDLSVISITGRLGKDAEILSTSAGDKVLKFSVGVSTGWGEKKITTWYNCSQWSKSCEKIAQYMTKGKQIAVSGEPSLRKYTTNKNEQGYSLEIRVNTITLIGKSEAAAPEAGPDVGDCENIPF